MLRIRDGDRAMLVQQSNLALCINFYHYLWVTNHFMQRFHICTVNIQVQMYSTWIFTEYGTVLYRPGSSFVDPDPGLLPSPDPWLIILFLDPDH